MGVREKAAFLFATCCLLALGFLGLAVLLSGDRDGGVSEQENRTLQGVPVLTAESVASGTFGTETEAYLSDQMPARQAMLEWHSYVMGLFSVASAEDALLQVDIDAILGEPDDVEETPAPEIATAETDSVSVDTSPTETEPSETGAEETVTDDIGNGYAAFSYRVTGGGYSRIFAFTDRAIQRTADTLNAYREALPEDGNVFFTYVPYSQTASAWLLHREKYCGWISNVEPELQLLCDPGVHVYSAVNTLEPCMQNGEPVYFMTDHHWTPLGAYTVGEKMLRESGIPTAAYHDYSYLVHKGFLGSIYNQIPREQLKSLSDQLELLYPLAPTRSYVYRSVDELVKEVEFMEYERVVYSAILGGNHKPWNRIVTGFHTGRDALVICDSFGVAFAPYLCPYYDSVNLCDLRNNKGLGAGLREYIAFYGIDDVYFVLTTGTGINSNFLQQKVREALG